MSYGYMKKEVERLREDIEALVTQAYQQDEADDAALGSRRGDELPAELARREDRLARIEAAMRRLEAQAKAEAEAERQRRADAEAERQRTGKKRRGKAPHTGGGEPRRQGPEQLYGSRAAYHADQQQGLGVLRQCASECGWGVSDHLGL